MSLFLTPNGRLEPERARAWGYQGPLDLTGLSPVWDPKRGGPAFHPLEPASVQDENVNWEIGFHGPGIDGPIFAFTEFEGKLVAGGAFVQAGQALSRYIATWDGERWAPLERGMNFWVVSLAVYRGSLIAGGNFVTAGGTSAYYIARWDGTTWTPLGGGTSGPVWALAVHEDRLIAGGFFVTAGGAVARNLASWDGETWSDFHGGVDGDVLGLLSSGGSLYVTGDFGHAGDVPAAHICRWDGTQWTALGEGIGDRGVALAEFGGRIVVGGQFLTAGGSEALNIATWDGSSWAPLGSGADRPVVQLVTHEDRLIAIGAFTQTGSTQARAVAAWDGASWNSVGDVLNDQGTAVFSYRGDLYLSGYFGFAGSSYEEGSSLDYLARLEGDRWRPVFDSRARGMNGPVITAIFYQGDLLAGGNFTAAGNTPAYRVARWDGRSWHPMGSGFTDTVYKLKVVNGTLYAAGAFSYSSSGVLLNGIAMWDGTDWRPMGSGFNRPVFDIEEHSGYLTVAGGMGFSNGRAVNRVVFWDGDTWRSLGTGMTGVVRDLAVHGGRLFAAGTFVIADRDVRYLSYLGPDRWERVEHPFTSPINTMISQGGNLIIGGDFFTRGEPFIRMVARWNGSEWFPMGEGFDAPVNALFFHQGTLLAGGQFSKSGNTPAHALARWDGNAWQSFGTGLSGSTVNPEVIALAESEDRLYVGGFFTRAGRRVANYFAEWSPYLPASLSGFTGTREGEHFSLQWSIGGTAEDSPEFDIYRESPGSPRTRLTAHPLWGETEYQYLDKTPPQAGASYWLAELDREGGVIWHGPVEMPPVRQPVFRLAQNVPNPFLELTSLVFEIPAPGHVSLVVYDISGAMVARLAEGGYPQGEYEVNWDGRDVRGNPVSAGLYFARLTSETGTAVRKILKQSAGP